MNNSIPISTPAVSTPELCEALQQQLRLHFQPHCRIVAMERNLSPYQSSFRLEELSVFLDNGAELKIIFKDLSRAAMSEEALQIKPEFIHEPDREIEIYNKVLAGAGLGTARFLGAVRTGRENRCWIFMEKIAGRELYQLGEMECWRRAAQWLSRFHARFSPEVESLRRAVPLIEYDENYYRIWMQRALRCYSDAEPSKAAAVRWLAERYEKAVAHLASLPIALLHGEFYASNILIAESAEGMRVCPVDWEMAAIGPSGIDLAALVSGNWSEARRSELYRAYFSEPDLDHKNLLYCRLFIAVQWLGWFGLRQPFHQHAYDWLGEALQLARELNL
jgi:hypothetical protein